MREEETLQVVGFPGFQGQFIVEGWRVVDLVPAGPMCLCVSASSCVGPGSYQASVATGLLPGPSAALIGD